MIIRGDRSRKHWIIQKASFLQEIAKLIPDQSRKLYKMLLSKKSQRLDFLHLLSRFEISPSQATMLYVEVDRDANGITDKDKTFIDNPYLLYELTRYTVEPIAFNTIDLGLFIKNPPKDLFPERCCFIRSFGIVSNTRFNCSTTHLCLIARSYTFTKKRIDQKDSRFDN